MDISLNFLEDRVEGTNRLRLTARQPIDTVTLDARNLSIHSVAWIDDAARPLDYEYRSSLNELEVTLPRRLETGTTFCLQIRSTCVPSASLLEGIYKDTTPPGAPQQYVSQCQQWGFQCILPVLDDCTAKCTMTATLEADARYTHLISNGNINSSQNPAGVPTLKPGNPERQIITYENNIPMAPYLFLACAGTWDVLEDEIVYPSGRHVKIEYLVPPGMESGAVLPMQILKQAILWQAQTQDYEYEREAYRTICMEKSNFGGMENVGNTTIITSAALIDEWTTDRRLQYAYGVIVHEFEHNQCGSDVTMETPFDMWLNEAFTVDVERRFVMSRFDPACIRLDEVDAMREPLAGPLAVEDAGHMGNIVREGFNDPDELVDGVTYVKAAEVINMLRLILGDEAFIQAKSLYFERHRGGNAGTDDFFACFTEISGRDLSQFRREWLHTIGYPRIRAHYRYEPAERTLTVSFTQNRAGHGGLFHVPVSIAAIDEHGTEIPNTSCIVEITGRERELSFGNVPRPAFVSFNRDCSFYGTFEETGVTPEDLIKQIRLDPSPFGRVEAMRRLTDLERAKLIDRPDAPVGEAWQETFAGIVRDDSLLPGLKAYLLRIEEQSLRRELLPRYRERYGARIRLLQTVAKRYTKALLEAYHAVDTYSAVGDPRDGVEERKLKAVLLRTLIQADTSEVHRLAETHFRRAWNISDKVSALHCINLSRHPERRRLTEEGYQLWKDHLSAYTNYLQIVGTGIRDDVFGMIAEEERRSSFHFEHPGHQRALFLPLASNNKKLWTDQGIGWVAETVARLAPVNENTANRLLACFQQVNHLGADLKPKVIHALEAIRRRVDRSKAPSVAGRVATYLDCLD